MEKQEAIEIINAGLSWANWTEEQSEAFVIARDSVKKQIPLRVIKIEKVSSQACPNCMVNANGKYCGNCGQSLKY